MLAHSQRCFAIQEAIEVLGCYTFMLSDGQRWSTCHMKQWYEPPPTTYLELATIEQEELCVLQKSAQAYSGIPRLITNPNEDP